MFNLIPSSDMQSFRRLHNQSLEHREDFWQKQSKLITWDKPFTRVMDENFSTGSVAWFIEGKLNACSNALDIHIQNGGGKDIALTFIDCENTIRTYTYRELTDEVITLAAALQSNGLKSGDRAALYLPDIPETFFFILACARLGITYVPIPSRFTPEVVKDIIGDCAASLLVITLDAASESYISRAKSLAGMVNGIPVVSAGKTEFEGTISYEAFRSAGADTTAIPAVSVDSEHPLLILYANSATGIPRGSVFATGGFIVQAAASFASIFPDVTDKHGKRSMACCVNLASSAGQSYGLWGPFINGYRIFISADGENPSVDRLHRMLEENPCPALLTTPRTIVSLKHEHGDKPLSTERLFPLVAVCGDVLTPRLVKYAGNVLTDSAVNVINMWVQSESGAAIINTYPHGELNRAGALGLPFFGIRPQIVNHLGEISRTNESGQLMFSGSWPAMIRTIWGQHERFLELYFRRLRGYYNTNDGVRIDGDGFYWFMGRLDDVIKVRGQSLATSEIEAVLISHPLVAESAVVSVGDDEGENIIAFLVLERSAEADRDALISELSGYIERRIGEFAMPTRYIVTEELPRTRTGKIVRRILRRIASGNMSIDEDLSHVVNPHSVDRLISKQGL
ncbi:AMP-binding protein [bacterium]|nr:AMP-binding protein [bacterium]